MKELFGLKDKDGNDYILTYFPAAGCVECRPVIKPSLPKTKEEFNKFLGDWANRKTKTTEEFLNKYSD